MAQELTMSEVLRDPLIRQLLRADGIHLGSLLEKAANRRNAQAAANGITPNEPATNMGPSDPAVIQDTAEVA